MTVNLCYNFKQKEMETTTSHIYTQSKSEAKSSILLFGLTEIELERLRWIISPVAILLFGCLGGLAAGSAGGDVLKLILIGIPSALTLSMVLSVSPVKYIVYCLTAAVVIDSIIFALHFIN
jgi:hypothetical protein